MKIELKTEACNVIFSRKIPYESDFFDFDIDCVMEKKFTGFYPNDFFCRLYKNDLRRLIQYFNKHFQGLKDGSISESPVYMPLEADIQIRCLDGDIDSSDDGYFSISILFNCGKINEDASNTYFGFETVIDVLDCKKFCNDINSLIN